jgi:hypothetical protein
MEEDWLLNGRACAEHVGRLFCGLVTERFVRTVNWGVLSDAGTIESLSFKCKRRSGVPAFHIVGSARLERVLRIGRRGERPVQHPARAHLPASPHRLRLQ